MSKATKNAKIQVRTAEKSIAAAQALVQRGSK